MRVSGPGFLATVSVFLQFFVNITTVKSLGMMLVAMQDEFDSDTWVLGTVFAVIECVSDLLGPLAGPLGKKFGARLVVIVAGVMVTAGLIIASQASSVLQLALSLNLLLATGYCMANVLTRATLAQHFDNRDFALASGIGQTGASFSLITQPPLIQLFIDTYGWRGALFLIGSIGAHLIVCGALLIPAVEPISGNNSSTKYVPLEPPTTQQNQISEIKDSNFKSFCRSAWKGFDFSLMKDYNFWIITFIFVVNRINRGAWVIYFVPHAVTKGIDNNTAASMVAAAGLAHLMGVLLSSMVVFKKIVTSTSVMLVTVVLVSSSFIVEPLLTSGWLISINAIVYVAGMAAVFAIGDVMVKEFLGIDRMANALGWMGFLSGVFRFFSGFVPGWIYDHSGSYDLAFFCLGAVQMVSAVPLLCLCLHNSNPCRKS